MAITGLYPQSVKFKSTTVCRFWLEGRCNYGHTCRFLHPDDRFPANKIKRGASTFARKNVTADCGLIEEETLKTITIKRGRPAATFKETPRRSANNKRAPEPVKETLIEPFSGPFANLANLQGHKKDVTGIVLPEGSDKLYTASRDGTLRLWNCNTGECVGMRNLGGEIGCLISEGTWVFASLPNLIKVWNIADGNDDPVRLNHSLGQVYAMEANEDLLFSGTQDGSILVWRGSFEANPFKLVETLTGHSKPVLSLTIGAGRLYSGSMDHTVRVWDSKNFQCLHVLKKHNGYVTSLLCWESFLLTSSLDKTILVWELKDGEMDVIYSKSEEHGIVKLDGMADLESQPVLFCSLKDNSVRLYQLPSFAEKGKIPCKKEVKAIKTGPGDLFFTGDGTGRVAVWKWSAAVQSSQEAGCLME